MEKIRVDAELKSWLQEVRDRYSLSSLGAVIHHLRTLYGEDFERRMDEAFGERRAGVG